MRKHIQVIYKHQKNLTPEAEQVVSFLGSNQDQDVHNALQSKKLSNLQRTALEGKLRKQELEHQLMNRVSKCLKQLNHAWGTSLSEWGTKRE